MYLNSTSSFRTVVYCFLFCIFLLFPKNALLSAAPVPDTGSLLRDIEKQPRPEQKQEIPEIQVPQPGPVKATDSTLKLTLSAVEFSGNQEISNATLEKLAAPYLNRLLTFADLQQLVAKISRYYQQQGFLTSRAYLPAQEIASGKLVINILEGKLASPGFSLKVDKNLRLKEEIAVGLLRAAIPEGRILTKAELERGLLLLDDLPGILARSTLVPGASVGTSELLVEASEGNLLTGSLDLDNYGGRYTGDFRAGGSLQLNNPSRAGDLGGLKLLNSGGGLNYLRGFYQRPVGFLGTNLGIAFTWMDYSLGEEFKNDDIEGNSQIYSLYLTHPVIRGREGNFNFSSGYDHKKLTDEALGVTTKEREIDVIKMSLGGNVTDHLFTVGVTEFSTTLTAGLLDLSGVPGALAIDEVTAKTDGSFYLLSGSVSHTRFLTNTFSIFAGLQGQLPFGNLDSSEKLSLGGPAGVRAYPQGEAGGDAGYILNAELRYDLNDLLPKHQLQIFLFLDHGRIWLHEDPWVGWQGDNPALENSYSLSGAGIGAVISKTDRYYIRAGYGWALGNNKGHDRDGNDSEGRNPAGQFWLQATYWF
jgi:hemolysin activation/secretion protein